MYAPVPTPGDLVAYLRATGWISGTQDSRWAVFTRTHVSDVVSIEVPLLVGAPGYHRAFSMLVADLARLEGRSEQAVWRDVTSTSLDTIRLSLQGATTRDGTLPVEAGAATLQATRDLLMAAACSAVRPQVVHPTRKPTKALDFCQISRISSIEQGSFVLGIDVPVTPMLQTRFDGVGDPDPDPPFERLVTGLLARAIAEAVVAAQEAEAGGGVEAFRRRSVVGVSANLCDALGSLLKAAGADQLTTRVSFGVRRPIVAAGSHVSVITPEIGRIFDEASRALRAEETSYGIEVVGPIVKLESVNPSEGGIIVLQAEVDGRLRLVRLVVGRDEYAMAVRLHQSMKFLHVVGDVRRRNTQWVLESPRGLTESEVPTQEA